MERQPVKSTNIVSAGYDADRQILRIEFVRGYVYDYHAVPSFVYDLLLDAPSAGRFHNAEIKGKYRYIQIWPVSLDLQGARDLVRVLILQEATKNKKVGESDPCAVCDLNPGVLALDMEIELRRIERELGHQWARP